MDRARQLPSPLFPHVFETLIGLQRCISSFSDLFPCGFPPYRCRSVPPAFSFPAHQEVPFLPASDRTVANILFFPRGRAAFPGEPPQQRSLLGPSPLSPTPSLAFFFTVPKFFPFSSPTPGPTNRSSFPPPPPPCVSFPPFVLPPPHLASFKFSPPRPDRSLFLVDTVGRPFFFSPLFPPFSFPHTCRTRCVHLLQ